MAHDVAYETAKQRTNAKPVGGMLRQGGKTGSLFPGLPGWNHLYRVRDSDGLTTQSNPGANVINQSQKLPLDEILNYKRASIGSGLRRLILVIQGSGVLAPGGAPIAVPFGGSELVRQPLVEYSNLQLYNRSQDIGSGYMIDLQRGLYGVDLPRVDPPSAAGPFTFLACYSFQFGASGQWAQLPILVDALPDWKDMVKATDKNLFTYRALQIPGTNAAQALLNTAVRDRLWTGATGDLTLTALTLDVWADTIEPALEIPGRGLWLTTNVYTEVVTGVQAIPVDYTFITAANGDLVMASHDFADGLVAPSFNAANPVTLLERAYQGSQQWLDTQSAQTFAAIQQLSLGPAWPAWQPNSGAPVRNPEHMQAARRFVLPGDPQGMGDGLRQGSKTAFKLAHTGNYRYTCEMASIADFRK